MIDELAILAESRKVVRVATAAIVLMFVYIAILYASGDPRLADGKLTAQECSWWELILIGTGVCSTLVIWMSGAAHAWRAGRWKWFLISVLFWPFGILYALLLGTRPIKE